MMRQRVLLTTGALAALALTSLCNTAQAASTLTGKVQILPVAGNLPRASPNAAIGGGILVSSTTIGYPTDGAPCYNCGPAFSIAIPYPLAALPAGSAFGITVQMQDVIYFGTPFLVTTITQNGQVIGSGSLLFPSPIQPNYVAWALFSGTLPTTTGTATIVVQVSDFSSGKPLSKGVATFAIY